MQKKLLEFKNLVTEFHTEGSLLKLLTMLVLFLTKGKQLGLLVNPDRKLYIFICNAIDPKSTWNYKERDYFLCK